MKYFSMFSGIGGFELGIERAYNNKQFTEIQQNEERRNRDFDKQESLFCTSENSSLCIGYSEIDKYAIQTYEKNFGKEVRNYGDATRIKPEELPDFDMLCGGFPCQAFSIAGKRRGFEDTRGTLFFEIARIVKVKRPKIVFLENVKGLLNHEKWKTFRVIVQTLSELGYNVQWMVLNSKFFGVPQNRERVFIIGSLRGEPRPEILSFRESNEEINESEISNTLPSTYHKITRGTTMIQQLNNPTHSNNRVYGEDGLSPSLNTAQGGNRQPKIVAMRGRNPNNPSDRTVGSPTEQRLELNSEGISNTLSSVQKDNLVISSTQAHSTRMNDLSPTLPSAMWQEGGHIPMKIKEQSIRRLTPLECERLQGFPDNWTEGVSDTQRYKQLGNAVTVNVIEAIFKQINKS